MNAITPDLHVLRFGTQHERAAHAVGQKKSIWQSPFGKSSHLELELRIGLFQVIQTKENKQAYLYVQYVTASPLPSLIYDTRQL